MLNRQDMGSQPDLAMLPSHFNQDPIYGNMLVDEEQLQGQTPAKEVMPNRFQSQTPNCLNTQYQIVGHETMAEAGSQSLAMRKMQSTKDGRRNKRKSALASIPG